MKHARPWFRKAKDAWYICLNGKQTRLAKGKKNRKEAEQLAHQLLSGAEHSKLPAFVRIADVLAKWFDYCDVHCASAPWYHDVLDSFGEGYGSLRLAELKPEHVLKWLKGRSWGPTSQNKAIGALQTAINHSVKLRLIPTNPIHGMPKPQAKHRERMLTPEEFDLIRNHKIRGQGFRDFLIALSESGARPGELARTTSEDINFTHGIIILRKHKTSKKSRKPRIIYLTPKLLEICQRLVQQVTPGTPIFLTIRGKPFGKNSLNCRFRQLRKKYPQLKGVSSYVLRHSYLTLALERGVPIAAAAQLAGHASTKMIDEVYGHLDQRTQYLRQMAVKATKEEGPSA